MSEIVLFCLMLRGRGVAFMQKFYKYLGMTLTYNLTNRAATPSVAS